MWPNYCHVLFILLFTWWAALFTLYMFVRDSSTNITSRCENALWDNQYVWISLNHTHKLMHPHTQPPGRRVCLCLLVSHFSSSQLLPPIKLGQSRPLSGVCLLPPEGTSPSARARPLTPAPPAAHASITCGLCEPPKQPSNTPTWLLLRNRWRWCPSSRGNVLVSHFVRWLLWLLQRALTKRTLN